MPVLDRTPQLGHEVSLDRVRFKGKTEGVRRRQRPDARSRRPSHGHRILPSPTRCRSRIWRVFLSKPHCDGWVLDNFGKADWGHRACPLLPRPHSVPFLPGFQRSPTLNVRRKVKEFAFECWDVWLGPSLTPLEVWCKCQFTKFVRSPPHYSWSAQGSRSRCIPTALPLDPHHHWNPLPSQYQRSQTRACHATI